MRKNEEKYNPQSCLSKAYEDEFLFVLRAKDPVAPFAIRAWADERVRTGKNKPDDKKITEALNCANAMEKQRNIMFS